MASYPSTFFRPFWPNAISWPEGDRIEFGQGGANLLVVPGDQGTGSLNGKYAPSSWGSFCHSIWSSLFGTRARGKAGAVRAGSVAIGCVAK